MWWFFLTNEKKNVPRIIFTPTNKRNKIMTLIRSFITCLHSKAKQQKIIMEKLFFNLFLSDKLEKNPEKLKKQLCSDWEDQLHEWIFPRLFP